MVGINLGSILGTGSGSALTGLASGLNSKEIIEALVKARQLSVDKIVKDQETTFARSNALGELKTLLTKLRTSMDALRNSPNANGTAINAFKQRITAVNSNTSTAGSTYLDVIASAGSPVTGYATTIGALAANKQEKSTVAITSRTASIVGGGGPITAGTMVITPTGGSAVNVTVTDGDSLDTIASNINAKSAETKVRAVVVQVSSTSYQLYLESINTGTANSYTVTGTPYTNFAFTQTQAAADSSITINGTTFTRSTNNINDIITGLTFNLKAITPVSTTLNVVISANVDKAKTALQEFVDNYNEFKLFAAKQQLRDATGEFNKDSVLGSARSNALSTTLRNLETELTRIVQNIVTGSPTQLAELGIKFKDFAGDPANKLPPVKNILEIDPIAITAMLAGNPDGVKNVFEFNFSTPEPTKFVVLSRNNKISQYTFDIDFDPARSSKFQFKYNNGSGTVTVDATYTPNTDPLTGGTITGVTGTPFEGLSIKYTGSSSATAFVTAGNKISHGIGDRLYNSLDDLLNFVTGPIQGEINTHNSLAQKQSEEIAKQNVRIESYRLSLIEKFSRLEATVGRANSILGLLSAQADARLSGAR